MTVSTHKVAHLPTWSPLYGPPPHQFSNCVAVGILCRAPEGVLQTLTPAPLEALGDLFHVGWLQAGEVDANDGEPHRNVHVVEFGMPVAYGDERGGHCTLEYIDSDMGMSVGRELWAWPKKLGSFVWEESADGFHLECHREGHLLIEADVELRDSDVAVDEMWPDIFGVRDDAPYLQVREVPPVGDTPGRAEVLRVDVSEGAVHQSRAATGRLRLSDGPHDAISILGPVEVLGVRVDHHDFVFPAGEVIGSVELPA